MDKPQIRQLTSSDWNDYRFLRLEALEKHPNFFLPSRDERQFTQAEWEARLSSPTAATFGLFIANQLVGITTIFIENVQTGADRAQLVGSYLRSEFRGQGLARIFFEARIQWAKAHGVRKLILEHRDDNILSFQAHQRHGFQKVSTQNETWPDGQTRPNLTFELDV